MSMLPTCKSPIRQLLRSNVSKSTTRRHTVIATVPSQVTSSGSVELFKQTPSNVVPISPRAKRIPSSTLGYYWDTAAPTSSQLKRAEAAFLSAPPKLLYSAEKFRTVNLTSLPEVAFLGRSNVGKSSLLNALMGRKICHTSSKPGRTRTMNFFAVGGEDALGNPGKLVVLDMPGYGKGSRQEWGPEIMKYLVGRKQLKRAFLLVDAVHGLKRSDEELLALLRENAISHQVILSKVDRVLLSGSKNTSGSNSTSDAKLQKNTAELQQIYQGIKEKIQPGENDKPEALGEIVACSAEKSLPGGKKLGINNVRWAVLAATGLGDKKRKIGLSDLRIMDSESENERPTLVEA